MNKVHIFYKDKSLYAYSIRKEYIKMFRQQRDMNTFVEIVHTMDDIELSVFMNTYKYDMLQKIPLYDGKKYYEIAGTQNEDTMLGEKCDELYNQMDESYHALSKLNLKTKYQELLDKLRVMTTNLVFGNNSITTERVYTLNTFYLFYKMFEATFDSSIKAEYSNGD